MSCIEWGIVFRVMLHMYVCNLNNSDQCYDGVVYVLLYTIMMYAYTIPIGVAAACAVAAGGLLLCVSPFLGKWSVNQIM
jgi:hypothetical protein